MPHQTLTSPRPPEATGLDTTTLPLSPTTPHRSDGPTAGPSKNTPQTTESHTRADTDSRPETDRPETDRPETVRPETVCAGCRGPVEVGERCPDCATCDDCAEATPWGDTILTVAATRICPACQHAQYWCCPDCRGINRDDESCGNYCDDDQDDDEDEPADGRIIHDYGYKPLPDFHGAGPLFLGLELEVATPRDRWAAARLADRRLGTLGYLKADESIGGGFEIVTHPMSYPWALEHFPWGLLAALRNGGCETTARTGLHVHLSRAGFAGPAHVYRWMKFVYRNQLAVTGLARRTGQGWAEFHDEDRYLVKDYAKGSPGSYRYRAINTLNTTTFELRIFASSLQPVQVQAALGFADASVEYTRNLTVAAITRHDGWAWAAFTAWVADRPAYAPLLNEITALSTTHREAEALTCVC